MTDSPTPSPISPEQGEVSDKDLAALIDIYGKHIEGLGFRPQVITCLRELQRRRSPPDSREREEAIEAAKRIVAAHEGVEKAKQETHPSFKSAVNNLAQHELWLANKSAVIVARALLSSPRDIRGEALEEAARTAKTWAEQLGRLKASEIWQLQHRIRSLSNTPRKGEGE